jgi:hypothetical protein
MSNYPIGAEHDPSAPWNELHTYCTYCDTKEMGQIARSMANEKAAEANESITNKDEHMSEEDFYDECYEKVMDESRLCTQCYLEDNADDWRED